MIVLTKSENSVAKFFLNFSFAQQEDEPSKKEEEEEEEEFPLIELDDDDDDEDEEEDEELVVDDVDSAAANVASDGSFNCVECAMTFAREGELRQHVK